MQISVARPSVRPFRIASPDDGAHIIEMMASIGSGLWQEAFSLLGFSDREKCLIENLIQLERGQRPPVPETLHAAADSDEFVGTGE